MKETKKHKIYCNIDDELYSLKKRIQKKHNLSWEEARDCVNDCIKELYGFKELLCLDYELAKPLLKQKPSKVLNLKVSKLSDIVGEFKKNVNKKNWNQDLLIYMRINTKKPDAVSNIGWKLSKVMSKDSLVVWYADSSRENILELKFYKQKKVKVTSRYDLLKPTKRKNKEK